MGQETKPAWRALVIGPVSVALAVALSACGSTTAPGSAGQSTSSATTSTSPTPTTTAATSSSKTRTGIPIYWIAESRRSFALYREFREVPDTGGPVSSAVSAMMSLKPLDPDYMTPWRPASRVTVSQKGDAITVDGAACDVWGVIRVGETTQRAPVSAVQAHTWVTSPQEGEDLPAGTVTFKGFGTAFEANFVWEVRNDSGAVVAKGFTMGGTDDGKFGDFTFTAKLNAGTYSVKVSGGDASGGAEGPGPAVDDKTFTVH